MGFFGQLLSSSVVAGVPDPSTLSNKLGWWRGDDFDAVTDGTEIAAWNDISGLNRDMVAIAASPSRQVVSRNSIATTKTSVLGQLKRGLFYDHGTTLFNLTADWSMFLIAKGGGIAETEEGLACFRSASTGQPEFRITRYIPTQKLYIATAATSWESSFLMPVGVWKCIVLVHVGGVKELYINDVLQTWVVTPTAFGSANMRMLLANEGNNLAGYYASGKLAEIIFFDAALSSGDRTLLWNYAVDRYGIGTVANTTVNRTYVSDGDTNGVFYFIGTAYGQNTTWANPNPTLITNSASSLDTGAAVVGLTNRAFALPEYCTTGNSANSWFKVDLGANNTLKLNGWTWRSSRFVVSSNFEVTAMKIEGSNDNTAWTQLDARTGLTWTTDGQFQSWTFTSNGIAYRYFKVTQTAVNDGGSNYFTCGDLELYGEFTYGL